MPFFRNALFYPLLSLFILTPSLQSWGGKTGFWVPFEWETPPPTHLVATRSKDTFVQSVRAHRHKKYTRVVFDLSRHISPNPTDDHDLATFQLELPNTRILHSAMGTINSATFPLKLKVSRTSQGSLLVSTATKPWKRYKWYVLQKPDRVVLDLYPHPSQPLQTKTTPPSKPSQPVSPPVTITSPPSNPSKEDMVIVIDPGHGGKDPGALGRKGTREKDIVLKIASRLKDLLKKKTSAKVLMTRENDTFIKLEDRAAFANEHKADIFLSIHINSHPKKSIKGLELYHYGEASDPRALQVAARENGTPLEDNGPAWQFILADKLHDKKIEDSQELAWTTRKALVKYLQSFYKIKDHGVKTAPFFVLRMTTMPAILAEVAFISNPTEENLLKSKTYQQRMAQGIYEGLKAYWTPLQTASK